MKRTMKSIRTGDIFSTNEGGSVTVTEVIAWDRINIKHNDVYGYETTVRLQDLNGGSIKNPYHPSVHGIGFSGVGPYLTSVNRQATLEYSIWQSMIQRCYSTVYQLTRPNYVDCSVDVRWHNFQNFAHWYCNQPGYNKGYELDKDILTHGNKVYSPETCVLVPKEINNLFRDFSNRSSNRELPTGVTKRGNRYRAYGKRRSLGTFDTIELACDVYVEHRRNEVLTITRKYKNDINENVYYALQALAYSI